MKSICLLILTLLTYNSAFGEDENNTTKPTYDSNLATELGADDYGMKMYVMAFLKKGPNRNQSEAEAEALQSAHMANIKRMAQSGDLVLAGPFGKNDLDMQGSYIFNVKTIEEAEKLTATDPAIKAGRLRMELVPWYGSAALMQVNELGQKLAKKSF